MPPHQRQGSIPVHTAACVRYKNPLLAPFLSLYPTSTKQSTTSAKSHNKQQINRIPTFPTHTNILYLSTYPRIPQYPLNMGTYLPPLSPCLCVLLLPPKFTRSIIEGLTDTHHTYRSRLFVQLRHLLCVSYGAMHL